MELYRISSVAQAEGITASGCENRWNRGGQLVIYASGSRSLATLEMLVHRGNILPSCKYRMMVLSIYEKALSIRQVQYNELPDNWRSMYQRSTLQDIGASWYNSKESLLLKVPSVVVPHEFNYIINTEHPLFLSKVGMVGSEDLFWERRII
jgi:RES domain-containing protein